MLDHDKALLGQQLLGTLCTESEALELTDLARSMRFKNVGYGASLLSLAQFIERDPATNLTAMLLQARRSKDEHEAQAEVYEFARERVARLSAEVVRGRDEGDAKRQFREEMIDFMRRGWPLADDATLYLTLGQAFKDTPGVWTFEAAVIVVALRNLRRFG